MPERENTVKYDWSSYFQNSLHIESTRLMTLNDDLKDLLIKWLPLKSGQKILDVGCGNGVFTMFLGDCTSCSNITGVDLDSSFIEDAQKRDVQESDNDYRFIRADGLKLPFEDETFDLVISQTYLTSVPYPEQALKEKIRVAKKGGFVASITGQSFTNQVFSLGNYPNAYLINLKRLYELRDKSNTMYQQLVPQEQFIQKKSGEKIPQLFGKSGLRNISMHPMGVAFSLSDSNIKYETKKKFIITFYNGEIMKLKKYKDLEGSELYMSSKEVLEYIKLIKEHQKFLLDSLGENIIWEWFGGSNMLMLGQKSKY